MTFKGKKLLILGGIKLACDIVIRAQKMGLYVIVADYNVDSPAKLIADEGVLINAMDVDSIVSYCEVNKIDGVITGFIDILMRPCLEVCKRLKLPCYFTDSMIELSTNKIAFKNVCNLYGVPVPQTYLVGSALTNDICKKIHYPVFIKPLDSSGSRGASVCWNQEELERQFEVSLNYSPTKNVIIEDFLKGREFLLNIIAQNGDYRVISMFDRYSCNDRSSAINYANLSKGPSQAIDYYYEQVEDKVIKMFRQHGFNDGIFFLQGYFNGDTITFFEMGCRLGGAYYDLENKCIGVDPIEMLISYAITGKMSDDITALPMRVGKYDEIAVCVNFLLSGSDKEEKIFKIEGISAIMNMSSYVHSEQRYFEGNSFKADNTIDKPILCVYLVVKDIKQLICDINYMNSVFHVTNHEGQSLLKEKFNPMFFENNI